MKWQRNLISQSSTTVPDLQLMAFRQGRLSVEESIIQLKINNMEEIKEKEKLINRINELKAKGRFSLVCGFCGGSTKNFEVNPFLLSVDGVKFIQVRCPKCGNSLFLSYDILMKDKD